jgi:subtilisin-like proprotein convertase family protein
VTVQLVGLNHTFPDDVDMLLVSPTGDKLIIMSDAGGTNDWTNASITLDDAAAILMSDGGANGTGTYRPSNYGTGDTFAAPAPAAPYQSPATAGSATFASVFNGKNPNGTWSLYVVDDASGDLGSITSGWRLNITSAQPVCCSQACTLTCPADIVTGNDPGLCGASVGFGFGVTGSCGVVAGSPASGSFFPVGTTGVLGTGTSTSDGVVGTCTFNVTVNDTESPVIACPADVDANNDPGLCSAVVTYPAVTATDNCPGVVVGSTPPSGSTFPVGTSPVGGGATDAVGNSAACSFNVNVHDVEGPTLTASLSPDSLWPPNHRMMDVTATILASDNCGAATVMLSAIGSNEADDANGTGDGSTTADIQGAFTGTSDTSFTLRAERNGTGQGRFYTASYTATDQYGNTTTSSPTVYVPHDQGGVVDPLSLVLAQSTEGTGFSWGAVGGAQSYSVIKGSIANIQEETNFINLGAVTCLEAAGQSTTLAQHDTAIPAVGEVYFYAVAYSNGNSSSYGTAMANKPRVTAAGGCE